MFEQWSLATSTGLPKVQNIRGNLCIHRGMDYAIAELQNVADYCGISFTEWLFDRDPKDVFPQ